MAFNPLAAVGRSTLGLFRQVGRLSLFTWTTARNTFSLPFYPRLLLEQLLKIGYFSVPVVGLTAFFTGAALAYQIYIGGARFNAETIVPNIVVLGITRELGPVIASLMVAGRVAAAIAAEMGTMRVTEQIDALSTLSTNPFKYLVVPRILAGLIALPLLVLLADAIGVMGGYVVATQGLGFNAATYLQNTWDFMEWSDVTSGLYKAAVFGVIITLMGCYQGFYSKGGAEGVGRATTNAVVASSILILAANFLMTSLLFNEGATPL